MGWIITAQWILWTAIPVFFVGYMVGCRDKEKEYKPMRDAMRAQYEQQVAGQMRYTSLTPEME